MTHQRSILKGEWPAEEFGGALRAMVMILLFVLKYSIFICLKAILPIVHSQQTGTIIIGVALFHIWDHVGLRE